MILKVENIILPHFDPTLFVLFLNISQSHPIARRLLQFNTGTE